MKKRGRIAEKGTRISDGRDQAWDQAVSRYLQEMGGLNTEAARSHRFAMLVQELLGTETDFIENYAAGIERYLEVKQKDRILRGRVDNLFGNLVIEFERNIVKRREEAEGQLRRYLAVIWSQEPPGSRRPYLALATDGVRFLVYSPQIDDSASLEVSPENVALKVLEEADWTRLEARDIYFWLDRYFLRREILPPTGETIVRDFGLRSHAFQTSAQTLLKLWRGLKAGSSFAVVYESWEKYLRIVYGSDVAGDELFIRHTYLATLAKIMVWLRMSDDPVRPNESVVRDVLSGRFFKRQGLENFLEEDFFSWLGRSESGTVGAETVGWLLSLFNNYNLRELSEDVLKSLYQELVDPATRHDLGEFYTPDWLAGRMIERLLDDNPEGSLLDPSCGSGTFLYLAVREKRRRLGDSRDTFNKILSQVAGADIHPLASIVAKTNYILALGDLLRKRGGPISIPVYLADTLKLPERFMKGQEEDIYEIKIDSEILYIHGSLLEDPVLYDRAVEAAKDFALQNREQSLELDSFRNYLESQDIAARRDEVFVKAVFEVADTLKRFIEQERDTIWAFILKNIYKPLFFRRKFDFIVGNPPWVAFNYLDPEYQKFLKNQITEIYRLIKGRGELISQLEIATLFLVRAADLYLKYGGTIAFVLPRSIFTADQHHGFRAGELKLGEDKDSFIRISELWDCQEVEPLFNVPACVLLAEKGVGRPGYDQIPGEIIRGKLTKKNASLSEALKTLTFENISYSLHTRGKRSFWATGKGAILGEGSYYKDRFFNGATIYPRAFWFVRVITSPVGFDPGRPPLETDPALIPRTKEKYRGVRIRGNVERPFIYATLLSSELIPFGHLFYRMVVLPILKQKGQYVLIDPNQAHKLGYYYLWEWLQEVEKEWSTRRGIKADRATILERLDYHKKLSSPNLGAKYNVLYNSSGTFLTAAIVESKEIIFNIQGQDVVANGFIPENTTFYYSTDDQTEAWYLSIVLNSPFLDQAIKPMMARGLWGPRHIHKKVWELPIPRFDSRVKHHARLAELGETCAEKVKKWLAGGGGEGLRNIGKLRSMVRSVLRDELREADELVKGLGVTGD
ncbi:MAG: N-6 DNA methylase [Thermodesulfobacteriota bacterium]